MALTIRLVRQVPGHMLGFRWSSMLIELKQTEQHAPSITLLASQLLKAFASTLESAGFGTFASGKIISSQQDTHHIQTAQLLIPAPVWLTNPGFELLQALLKSLLNANPDGSVFQEIDRAVIKLNAANSTTSNTPRLLKAAAEQTIPVLPMGNGTFQFGHGARARWMQSTLTDQSSVLGVRMARDKVWAANVLRHAGLPVPHHQLVDSEQSALKAARQLGYPVVVKPADLDGGVGVHCNLNTDGEVVMAFSDAKVYSKRVLVEKHIQGKDYRLTVFHGQLLWAIHRVPAGVTGDDVLTVEQLVEQCNKHPSRGTGPHAVLKHIVLNDESFQLLDAQGLGAHSVPPAGQFVQLRRAANVASGGMPVNVIESVHPDNAALAVRAAKALRLDLAGIDLLIPDISVSWLTSGGAICEINAQPQLGATTGPHLYGEILKKLLPNRGRIPIVVVLGDGNNNRIALAVEALQIAKGVCVGRASSSGFFINGTLVGNISTFEASIALLRNPDVDYIIVQFSDESIFKTGLPFDEFQTLIVQDLKLVANDDNKQARNSFVRSLMSILLPACQSQLINLSTSGCHFREPLESSTATLYNVEGSSESQVQQIISLLS